MKPERKDDPRDRELDRILVETEILPSSGFTASVMGAVRREASAPPPIPFPWKRALPGIAVAGAMLILVVVVIAVQFARNPAPSISPTSLSEYGALLQSTFGSAVLWVALALLASLAGMKLSLLFLARKT